MNAQECALRDGRRALLRAAAVEDAVAILDHLAAVSAESDFLSFGPGEMDVNVSEEEVLIRVYRESPLKLFLLARVEGELVGTLTFAGQMRPRLRHTGDVGMAVRRAYWSLGIGSGMLDVLLAWARSTEVITKLNLRVRSDNERAIRLYERKGFVKEGLVSRELFIGGQYFSQYCMGLEL